MGEFIGHILGVLVSLVDEPDARVVRCFAS